MYCLTECGTAHVLQCLEVIYYNTSFISYFHQPANQCFFKKNCMYICFFFVIEINYYVQLNTKLYPICLFVNKYKIYYVPRTYSNNLLQSYTVKTFRIVYICTLATNLFKLTFVSAKFHIYTICSHLCLVSATIFYQTIWVIICKLAASIQA